MLQEIESCSSSDIATVSRKEGQIVKPAKLVLLLLGMGCCSSLLQAQQPQKIAVVNMQAAILGTRDGQKASQELKAKVDPKRKDFEARQNEINRLEDQLRKGASVMSDDKKAQMARDIEEKKKRLERDTQDANDDLQNEQQKILQNLGQRLMAVLDKYAADNGYNLVIDVGNPNTPVLFAATGIDITKDIVDLYDKTPASPAPAASSNKQPPAGSTGKPRQ